MSDALSKHTNLTRNRRARALAGITSGSRGKQFAKSGSRRAAWFKTRNMYARLKAAASRSRAPMATAKKAKTRRTRATRAAASAPANMGMGEEMGRGHRMRKQRELFDPSAASAKKTGAKSRTAGVSRKAESKAKKLENQSRALMERAEAMMKQAAELKRLHAIAEEGPAPGSAGNNDPEMNALMGKFGGLKH